MGQAIKYILQQTALQAHVIPKIAIHPAWSPKPSDPETPRCVLQAATLAETKHNFDYEKLVGIECRKMYTLGTAL